MWSRPVVWRRQGHHYRPVVYTHVVKVHVPCTVGLSVTRYFFLLDFIDLPSLKVHKLLIFVDQMNKMKEYESMQEIFNAHFLNVETARHIFGFSFELSRSLLFGNFAHVQLILCNSPTRLCKTVTV